MPKRTADIEAAAKKIVSELVEATVAKEEEKGERIPGKIVNGRKTIWTQKDIEARFPICEFTPDETIPVIYNGIRYQLIADVSMVAPTIIRDIYLEHRRKMRQIGKGLVGVTVYPGAGALTPQS